MAGLSASPPPALPALFLVFEEGGKISKKIQKRGLDLFKRAGQGWPIGQPSSPLFCLRGGGYAPKKFSGGGKEGHRGANDTYGDSQSVIRIKYIKDMYTQYEL